MLERRRIFACTTCDEVFLSPADLLLHAALGPRAHPDQAKLSQLGSPLRLVVGLEFLDLIQDKGRREAVQGGFENCRVYLNRLTGVQIPQLEVDTIGSFEGPAQWSLCFRGRKVLQGQLSPEQLLSYQDLSHPCSPQVLVSDIYAGLGEALRGHLWKFYSAAQLTAQLSEIQAQDPLLYADIWHHLDPQQLYRFLRNLLREQFHLGNLSAILDVLIEEARAGEPMRMSPALLEVLLSQSG